MILELYEDEVKILKEYLTKETTLIESVPSNIKDYSSMMSILYKIYEKEKMTVTTKQTKLIDKICCLLNLEKPKIQTKEEASKFISKYIKRYVEVCAIRNYDWENEFYNG